MPTDYNQFAPQKSPAGDQRTNFIMTEYDENDLKDQMNLPKVKNVTASKGWDVYDDVRQPI